MAKNACCHGGVLSREKGNFARLIGLCSGAVTPRWRLTDMRKCDSFVLSKEEEPDYGPARLTALTLFLF